MLSNPVPVTRQDFGWRNAAHPGSQPGEIGGWIQRSLTPAWFAKVIPTRTGSGRIDPLGDVGTLASSNKHRDRAGTRLREAICCNCAFWARQCRSQNWNHRLELQIMHLLGPEHPGMLRQEPASVLETRHHVGALRDLSRLNLQDSEWFLRRNVESAQTGS